MNKTNMNSFQIPRIYRIEPNEPNEPGVHNCGFSAKMEAKMSRRLTKHKQRAALDLAELCLVVARAGAQELTTEDFQMVQFYMRDVLRHVRAAAKQCAVVMPDILREID